MSVVYVLSVLLFTQSRAVAMGTKRDPGHGRGKWRFPAALAKYYTSFINKEQSGYHWIFRQF